MKEVVVLSKILMLTAGGLDVKKRVNLWSAIALETLVMVDLG